MKRLISTLALACTFSLTFAADTLYATGVGGLYTVNTGTGAATLLYNYAGQDIHLHNGGLVYDPVSDLLYANGYDTTSKSALYSINRFSGTITRIGYADPDTGLQLQSLALDPTSGKLYSTAMYGQQSSAYFEIDKSTGVATKIGNASGQFTAIYGLGFRSDGAMFGNGFFDYSTKGTSDLLSVNSVTGATTLIGSHGLTLGRTMAYSGIAFAGDGTMFSLGSVDSANAGLFSVNPLSAQVSLIGNTVEPMGVDGGLAFAPSSVPEPATMTVAGIGLIGLARRSRRRSSAR
ncbi:MAG: PEP-CTERM sorting domain-containing protein [Armatimonadetes bacterium]|nr:PEP-CTERM sorting domain-containing protein [Armatimonadota bacterium]